MNNTLIKNMPKSERPRERLKKYGKENISNEELLSIILNTGTKNKSVKDISNLILSKINDITDLKDITLNSLKQIDGIGEVRAMTIKQSLKRMQEQFVFDNVMM